MSKKRLWALALAIVTKVATPVFANEGGLIPVDTWLLQKAIHCVLNAKPWKTILSAWDYIYWQRRIVVVNDWIRYTADTSVTWLNPIISEEWPLWDISFIRKDLKSTANIPKNGYFSFYNPSLNIYQRTNWTHKPKDLDIYWDWRGGSGVSRNWKIRWDNNVYDKNKKLDWVLDYYNPGDGTDLWGGRDENFTEVDRVIEWSSRVRIQEEYRRAVRGIVDWCDKN